MKAFTAFVLLLSISGLMAYVYDAEANLDVFSQVVHPYGAYHLYKETGTGSESIVYLPENGLFGHQEHFTDYQNSFLHHQRNPHIMKSISDDPVMACVEEDKADYLKFFPTFLGTLSPANDTFQYSAPCFKTNTLQLFIVNDTVAELIHTSKDPSKLGCSDTYIFTNLKNFHDNSLMLPGTHKTTFVLSAEEMQLVKTTGIFVFRTCDRLKDIIPDILKTSFLFLGEIELALNITNQNKSVPTPFDIQQSIEFTKEATGYVWQERPKEAQTVVVDLDESLVNSGDFFAVKKFDGTGNLVEYGTGAHVNHCTVALRVNGELYIVESNSDFEWPRAGIQMNPYKTWVQWATNQGYQVSWVPLKQEVAQKYNSTAAYEFFQQYDGVPYGIHNYIWGWLDTPDHSYPPMLPPEFFGTMFAFVENLKPQVSAVMYGEAMNKRLGTENLTVYQLAEEAYTRNLTLPDLYAMPEIDGWIYDGNVSYVCSAFVTAMLKAGGLFDGLDINAVEFTPRDVYQLEFYDPAPTIPEYCHSIDPTNQYCQIMGQYRIEFQDVGSVSIHEHMNENCWSEPPLYAVFPPGC